ncbi:MAG TPA: fibronectin type III domain-containing protein [Candidatus Absconditabacterales bacterium]|nr:fibronectin type III domain-containing protein [Candidatus Absconditabacterales bacterium]
MKRLYPKFLFVLFTFVVALSTFVFAEEPDAFLVQVEPDTFAVGESVDVTISAVKNGMIVKEYIGDVFIEVEGLMPDSYVVPSDGLYSFLIQDQGIKLFSKGLQVQEAGTYTLKVSDIIDDTIMGQTTIIVGNGSNSQDLENINISSPIAGSTERNSSVNIIGSSSSLKNSPVEAYLNGVSNNNGYTDSQGNFNLYVSPLQSGTNDIQVKITDINDIVLGQSDLISIIYQPIADGIFESLEFTPNSDIKQGDKVSFNVYTSEEVTSVTLKMSNSTEYPMDRLSPGIFNKEITMTTQGNIDLSLSIMAGTNKNYNDISSIFVQENTTISNIKFHSVGVDGTSVNVSWDPIGDSPKYRIFYGTDRNSLQKMIDVNSTEVLIENLQQNTIYYFQVLPMDEASHSAGEMSEIVEYDPDETYSSCVVKGIIVSSEKIGDKYYLTRDAVENADNYEIYKSNWEDMSDSHKVGETTDTRFEYSFNKLAEEDQYAYYQVQAVCTDGSNVTIDEAKKVKVGPFENTILVIIISLLLYSIYRLYRIVE